MPNAYTHVIDLTQKAQREARRERDMQSFTEPESALPPVDFDRLPDNVQNALRAAGWETLMPVQQAAIPYMLERRDLIVQSRTGSGKTGAFLLPLFELLDPSRDVTQALVLTPTRELARQIYEEFERMKVATTETNELRATVVYGGVKYGPQIRALKRGAHVVIGTPGRILDHLEKGNFSLKPLEVLVFDEADEMLSMGFYPAMKQLKRYLPRERQTYMFSATIPAKVRSLSREFLDDPGFLSLSTGQVSVDTIEHRYYVVDPMEKDRALIRLIEMENPDSAIIFANTKRDVEYLSKFLQNYGHNADEISGDLSQAAREQAMGRLREGKLRFLVATDVAARGIDISDLSHVFMYEVPQDPEYYVHRSGRTARAGKAGVAIVLATVEDERNLLSISNRYDIQMQKTPLPSPEDVSARVSERMTVMLEGMMRDKTNIEKERLGRFVPLVRELVAEEPELLAMLVDAIYMRQLHDMPAPEATPAEVPAAEADADEDAPEAAAEADAAPEKRRKKRKSKKRRSSEEKQEKQDE